MANRDDDDHTQAAGMQLLWSNPDLDGAAYLGSFPGPSSYPSASDVKSEAKKRVIKIFDDYVLLNRILQRHEALIQKRWLKKTREQRRTILLSAWPDMPTMHRPDLEDFANDSEPRTLIAAPPKAFSTKASKDIYLWPHINQEDLLKPKLFLIFLNARGRHSPSAFVEADRDSIRFAITSGKVQHPFLGKHTMMLTGRTTPTTYGQVHAWSDNKDARAFLWSGLGEEPGKGLQVLAVQERVYSFLLECCLQVLQDKSRESLEKDTSPIEPEPPALSIVEGNVNSLADIRLMAPYRLPARLDLSRLYDLVAARKSAAVDHVWAIREDPGYFMDMIMEEKDHIPENIRDQYGRPHSLMSSKDLWNRIDKKPVGEAYHNLNIWTDIEAKLRKTMTLQEKYKSVIKPVYQLPVDLLESFLDLQSSLYFYYHRPLTWASIAVIAAPPMRAAFTRRSEAEDKRLGTHLMHSEIVPNKTLTVDKARSRLRWLWSAILNPVTRERCGQSLLLDGIEHLIDTDPKGKELFSTKVASMIEDVSLIQECLNQISCYQPWASRFPDEGFKDDVREDRFMGEHNRRLEKLREFDLNLSYFKEVDVDPRLGRFYYPVDKRRTKETTEAMQQAERNLDEYWLKLDNFLSQKVPAYRSGPLANLLKSRSMYRTPDWTGPDTASSVPKNEHQVEDDIIKPLSQLYLDSERVEDSGFKASLPKSKAKTRGVTTTDKDQSVEPAEDDSESAAVDPVFPVDKRALKVFSILFYQPSSSAQPGEIPWNDFLHAMTSVGFAVEKLYGSIWHFSPSVSSNKSVVWDRSIQFHEPHPVAKIPYRTARRFGRRLSKAYGWRGDMFTLSKI
ncbi:hypothetical protein BGZ83_011356 [Gryganskiella cystojenkinii]|nr:hypothetical protein BGZ83_011356 [Gryganskiella cystojenkinii]